MDILSQREALIADLNDQLVSAEDCPNQVEGAETLPYDMFREYQCIWCCFKTNIFLQSSVVKVS